MRNSEVSKAIYRRHIRLYRYINDMWIFTTLTLPELKARMRQLEGSKSKAKKPYPVPKRGQLVKSKRRDSDIALVYKAQIERGIFENNIVGIISRVEAFIQECLVVAITQYPEKLSIIADKTGIPVELFLAHESRQDVLTRYVANRCESLMFGKPADYIAKAFAVLSIEIKPELIADYIEIKASRDIIIHNLGEVNQIYVSKAGTKARAQVGEELPIDMAYFRKVVMTVKAFSGAIQSNVEKNFQ